MGARILVCDDEADIREMLRMLLSDEGFEVTAVSSGAIAAGEAPDYDAILLDIKMPGQDGLETLEKIRSRGITTPIVMISGHGDVRTAMQAIRGGANDFLEKPLGSEHVLNALRRVIDSSRLARENQELKRRLGLTRLVGGSRRMQRLIQEVARAAPTPATVLLLGPSGSGKELAARSIHEASLVRNGPFVQVNCAAIPDSLIESELFGHERGSFTGADRKQTGKFVEADGGTIFLDEIGDMSAPAQAKVLRVLQEGEVEPVGSPRVVKVKVRVIAATNQDLPARIREGKFREDLYYRLNVLPILTPALGEHPEDIPELVLTFSESFARNNNYRPKRYTDAALEAMAKRPWPGNVRELKNAVERLMIMVDGEVIDAPAIETLFSGLGPARDERPPGTDPPQIVVRGGRVVTALPDGSIPAPAEGSSEPPPSMPSDIPSPAALPDRDWARLLAIRTLQEFQDEAEKLFLEAKLAENGWNVTRTAEAVETPRSNLYKKMERYGLKRERLDSEDRRKPGGEEP
ncbi:MAG: sigma-54-dependent Fis family transcriptional regulator [Acidobacteria bacterium]|nr:sigma-54-dependent Fis family transcriptional regulator [Acidobacteriota bacterium]MCG3191706.1 Anaerobic nitric oxide reductase transcription regulator NorR [Thermoanaerobaculia bacterium]MCK6680966.1 sigma-54 dependent transcriptional regulator [Thermoanaerobaculia bacterium]